MFRLQNKKNNKQNNFYMKYLNEIQLFVIKLMCDLNNMQVLYYVNTITVLGGGGLSDIKH